MTAPRTDKGEVGFTPGPWIAKREDDSERGWCVYDAAGMLVARRLTEANAALIARAPELLAENKRLRAALETFAARAGQPGFDVVPDHAQVTFFAKDVRDAVAALGASL